MLQSDRFDQVHMNYTSSLAVPNEACQISPNLYEASNLQLTVAGGDSGLTVPQSPDVTGPTISFSRDGQESRKTGEGRC
jgi:hypothetical protein